MTDFNSNIIVDTQGIDDFVEGLQRAEKEVKLIEKEFRKIGIPEDKLNSQATAFRNKLIADNKKVEAERIATEKRVQAEQAKTVNANRARINNAISSTRSVGREALGVFIGGGLGEVFSNIVSGLSSVLKANKGTDKELQGLDKTLTKLKVGFTNIALVVLRFVAGPMRKLVDITEKVASSLFGISFEADKASVTVQKLQDSFNAEIAVLKEGNISQEARAKLIQDINQKYKDYLPNLLDENATLEDITTAQKAANTAFERKILLLASEEQSIDLAKRRLDALREEVDLQKELNQAIENEEKAKASGNNVGKTDINIDEVNARIQLRNIRSQIEANKENLKVINEQKKALNDIIKSEGINVKTDFVGLDKGADNVVKAIKTGKATIEIDTKLKNKSSDLVEVAKDIQSDLNEALSENRLDDAAGFIKELTDIREAYEDVAKVTEQAGKTQLQLNRELAAAEASVKDLTKTYEALRGVAQPIFESGINDPNGPLLSEQLTTLGLFKDLDADKADELTKEFVGQIRGNLFSVFETPGLNNQEADELFGEVFARSKGFVELINNLADEGIRSPLFESIIGDKEAAEANVADLTEKIKVNAELIKDAGFEAAKKQQELDEAVLKAQEEIAKRRIKINEDVIKNSSQLFRAIETLATESGTSTVLTEFISKESEFRQANKLLQEEIAKTQKLIDDNAGDQVLVDNLKKQLDAQTELLTETKKKQRKELDDIGVTFAERELAAFNKRFKDERAALENSLREQTLDIRDAKAERDSDLERFNRRAERDNREFNDKEIDVIEAQTAKILELENKRSATEQRLRVGAAVEALIDIEKRGGDAEVLLKKFNLDERQLIAEHYAKIAQIVEEGVIEVKEKRKGLLTDEETVDLLVLSANAFGAVFTAYLEYQDAIADATADRIRDQLDFINSEISETVSNLSDLESDLEGKREGRRDALLRGIEVEKEREAELTKRKIALQEQLEAEERKQAQRRKEAAIAQALINGALAVTNIWANSAIPYPAQAIYGAVQTAAQVGITAFQVGAIQAQQFADGDILQGNSHAQGGIPFTLNGVPGFEAEGGEAIINKRSVQMYKPLLSAINEAGGGKKFQQGAVLGANFDLMNQGIGISSNQINELINKQVFVSVSEINNVQERQARVVERSSF